ncbi:hypothetical protein CGCF415_v007190 [Colletotrichum fructicola]|uniref:Uncharacterized protein n=1 Tax=Colletotrichum fructicola (strain Nara gc5) TaxID=1213859 RepID=A0A7J6IR56_COLFN|nr:hypothetical protein CGGC5_v011972 [Colletotrichum fructicola Nara gc5]KAF4898567.1 hypothetical protein CGCFRS4_v004458 [Colletotrichum fructicola]KAF4907688.1 hypothetical protein CGCF415_v007190 [Colletotrichum fructicola]KAF4941552.1 hypothetical protein CGCF245_v001518 [Colletotrichum fructicola]
MPPRAPSLQTPIGAPSDGLVRTFGVEGEKLGVTLNRFRSISRASRRRCPTVYFPSPFCIRLFLPVLKRSYLWGPIHISTCPPLHLVPNPSERLHFLPSASLQYLARLSYTLLRLSSL